MTNITVIHIVKMQHVLLQKVTWFAHKLRFLVTTILSIISIAIR